LQLAEYSQIFENNVHALNDDELVSDQYVLYLENGDEALLIPEGNYKIVAIDTIL
jgi:hypothetical protein